MNVPHFTGSGIPAGVDCSTVVSIPVSALAPAIARRINASANPRRWNAGSVATEYTPIAPPQTTSAVVDTGVDP